MALVLATGTARLWLCPSSAGGCAPFRAILLGSADEPLQPCRQDRLGLRPSLAFARRLAPRPRAHPLARPRLSRNAELSATEHRWPLKIPQKWLSQLRREALALVERAAHGAVHPAKDDVPKEGRVAKVSAVAAAARSRLPVEGAVVATVHVVTRCRQIEEWDQPDAMRRSEATLVPPAEHIEIVALGHIATERRAVARLSASPRLLLKLLRARGVGSRALDCDTSMGSTWRETSSAWLLRRPQHVRWACGAQCCAEPSRHSATRVRGETLRHKLRVSKASLRAPSKCAALW